MKKTDFYLYLNILNIIFTFFVVAMAFILFITLAMAPNMIIPACMFLIYIIIKFLFFFILFKIYEKIFPLSILNKIQKELKTDPTLRKNSILLAFSYDAIIMLCFALRDIIEYRFEWASLLAYEILTFGGVWMFYVALFTIWKIQGKLKA
jgi:hypothetical protein